MGKPTISILQTYYTPCYKCTTRSVTCHAKCEKYKKFRVNLEKCREAKRKSEGKQRRVFR